jgi:voltage-gated potassium channel Kch
MIHYAINEESALIQYLNSIYFATITMVTVGYGDISPITPPEKIYTIFMAICSSANFAYIVNTIGQIFLELAQRAALLKRERYLLINYMSARNTSKVL